MYFIDSHCHLPSIKHEEAIKDIIERAQSEDVVKFVNIGTSISDNVKALAVAKKFPQVYATAAIYPHEDTDYSLEELKKYLIGFVSENRENLVGIGEAGIDITDRKGGRTPEEQLRLFEFQASLAKEHNLPLIIHNRNGDRHVLSVLRKIKPEKGVVHCFSSDWEFAREILNLGFYISFSGLITYDSRKPLLDVVKKVTSDRFLIETDSPYLPPAGHRREKNEPKYVRIIAQKISEVRGIPLEQIAEHSSSNAETLFSI